MLGVIEEVTETPQPGKVGKLEMWDKGKRRGEEPHEEGFWKQAQSASLSNHLKARVGLRGDANWTACRCSSQVEMELTSS